MKTKIISVVFFILIFTSCEDFMVGIYTIKVTNHASEKIKLDYTFNYPDTVIQTSNALFKTIAPNSTTHISKRDKWEKTLSPPNDTISFFFFQERIFTELPWDSIRNNYLVLARYDLSLQDLQHRNFVIEYPYDPKLGKLKVYQKQ